MNKIRFEIAPSLETNDHGVNVLVDGATLFSDDQLGLDPPELFKQVNACDTGRILVGRCECGCVGCNDLFAQVSREPDLVTWQLDDGRCYEFRRNEYDNAMSTLLKDNSWEDLNRRLERLLKELFDGTETDDGLSFDWASTRIQRGIVHLSYSTSLEQRLLDFSWDGETEESALKRARAFIRERFE